REYRFEAGYTDIEPTEHEIQYAWVMHGGIFYFGVRKIIYEAASLEDKSFMIETSLDAFLMQLPKIRDLQKGR
ncbi:MAG: TetR/AcrR family transcriptional regulator, partial [Rhizobiales bacterium]|nr:TetR/AcrR family transcriptional regulator [Hyphomicrobiales bacterium]